MGEYDIFKEIDDLLKGVKLGENSPPVVIPKRGVTFSPFKDKLRALHRASLNSFDNPPPHISIPKCLSPQRQFGSYKFSERSTFTSNGSLTHVWRSDEEIFSGFGPSRILGVSSYEFVANGSGADAYLMDGVIEPSGDVRIWRDKYNFEYSNSMVTLPFESHNAPDMNPEDLTKVESLIKVLQDFTQLH